MADVKVNIIAEDNFSSTLGNFGSIMTGIESVINMAKRAFDAIVLPVVEFGKESILAAASVQELATVNRVLAEQNGLNAASIPPLVEAIRAQGIEAGIAQSTVSSFIKAQLDLSYATDLARIAQDSAVIAQTNSSEALDNIIYGITTLNPLVLRHAGIIVDLQLSYKEWADENGRTVESMTTAEKQQVALNEVMEYGAIIAGSYAAAMEEPGKVLRSFPRYFDDIMVSIGEPFQEAFADSIFRLADFAKWINSAVQEGGELRPLLDLIVEGVSQLSDRFVNFIDRVQSFVEGGGLRPLIDGIEINSDDINALLEKMDSEIAKAVDNYDWTASGAAFGSAVKNMVLTALGIEINFDESTPALGKALSDWFVAAMGVGSWDEARDVMSRILRFYIVDPIKAELMKLWEGAVDIGKKIVEGIETGLNIMSFGLYGRVQALAESIIKIFKLIFGISSPSTVFMEIGVNMIQGLMVGMQSAFGALMAFVTGLVSALLAPFAPVLDLFGVDTGGIGGASGSASLGGTSTTGTLTSTAVENYYNYYYGPVYFQGTGQTNGGVDCQSPNPALNALGSSLPAMGVA